MAFAEPESEATAVAEAEAKPEAWYGGYYGYPGYGYYGHRWGGYYGYGRPYGYGYRYYGRKKRDAEAEAEPEAHFPYAYGYPYAYHHVAHPAAYAPAVYHHGNFLILLPQKFSYSYTSKILTDLRILLQ